MLMDIYRQLFKQYGEQHWWPVHHHKAAHDAKQPDARSVNVSASSDSFEIMAGAILTQNTNWNNVEKALENLINANALSAKKISGMPRSRLEALIKPSGFYRQKAERLRIFSKFILNNRNPSREELLALKGIGPETADSIMLYAFGKPYFVVDAYTKRIFSRLGLIDSDDYEGVRKFFEKNIPRNARLYNEFHALIVRLAKEHCGKEPECRECPLAKVCIKQAGRPR